MDTAHPVIAMLSCIAVGVVGLVLARAVFHKLISHDEFRMQLGEYQLVPQNWVGAACILLTGAELIAISALLLPSSRATGAAAAGSLFIVYAFAMGLNIVRGRSRIDCGCGAPGQYLSWFLVSRNVVLVTLCVFVMSAGDPRLLSALEAIAAAASAFVLWLALVLADRVLGNRSHVRATSDLDYY